MLPIVKWTGGKRRLLPMLLERAPKFRRRYFEPFAGGAALFFALSEHRAVDNWTIADANSDLIAMYCAIADDHERVLRFLAKLIAERDEAKRHDAAGVMLKTGSATDVEVANHGASLHYLEVRHGWNYGGPYIDPSQRAAMFLYLNRTSFNGLWRVNRDGKYNVPAGSTDTLGVVPDLVRQAAPILQRVVIMHGDYTAAIADATDGDFVYLDPPYDVVDDFGGTSSFTSYTADGFGEAEQVALAAECRRLTDRGVAWLQSNADTPRIRALYPRCQLDPLNVMRTNGGKGAQRALVDELIISNAPDLFG